MTTMTPEQYKAYALQWAQTSKELEQVKRKALRGKPYDEEEVNALLELGDSFNESRTSSGLQQMQEELARAYGGGN